jgi:hypothetical protein
MVRASRLKSPLGGYVDTVLTLRTHRRLDRAGFRRVVRRREPARARVVAIAYRARRRRRRGVVRA